MLLPLAMGLIGSPFDSELQVSDIGLLILMLLFLFRLYQKVDKFEETLAKRLESKIHAAERPKPIEIFPTPFVVKAEEKFPTETECKERHERLQQEFLHVGTAYKDVYARLEGQGMAIASLKTEMGTQTASLAELKSQIGSTDRRIEDSNKKADDRTTSLRMEIKADLGGIHNRINDVLAAVSEQKGKHS